MSINSLSNTINKLDNDISIIQKLLYRNKNQHGKTKYYTYIHQVIKMLHIFTPINIEKLDSIISINIRMVQTVKVTSENVSYLIVIMNDCKKAIVFILEVTDYCTKANSHLLKLISNAAFVPVFSVLLASTCSIFDNLTILLKNFYNYYKIYLQTLQQISLTNERFTAFINDKITNSFLTTIQINNIDNLITLDSTTSNKSLDNIIAIDDDEGEIIP